MLEAQVQPHTATLKLLHLSQKIAIPRIRHKIKKDDSAGKIDIEKNSMYYAKYNVREGFSAYCVQHGYEDPQIVDCSVYFCDGDDMVRLKFDFLDLAEQTQRKRVPEASDLMRKTDMLARQYEDYVPTEITKNEDACREKKGSVGQFTKPVSFRATKMSNTSAFLNLWPPR